MIQINTLYSLQDIQSYYYITNEYKIINTITGREKKITVGKRNYPYVTLATGGKRDKKVYMHKLVALSFIKNEPYELIEHKDDNTLNYIKENLVFGTHRTNGINAFKTGLVKRKEKVFELFYNNKTYRGTIKELVIQTGISKSTLYDNYYKNRPKGLKIEEVVQ